MIDDADTVIWRGRTASTGEAIGAALKAHAPNAARIGLESGQLAVWLFHQLKSGGFPVICIDARHAKAALSLKVNKTDANDAWGVARIMRVVVSGGLGQGIRLLCHEGAFGGESPARVANNVAEELSSRHSEDLRIDLAQGLAKPVRAQGASRH